MLKTEGGLEKVDLNLWMGVKDNQSLGITLKSSRGSVIPEGQ
ncbi:MAG: hypothetical protein ACP5H7_02625 [Minisyncoccia bacterium]